MKLYALKDVKAGLFGAVMMGQNDAHMTRTLCEVLEGSRETVARFPGDFELFQIGEYEQESGGSSQVIRFVCNMDVVLKSPNGNGADHA